MRERILAVLLAVAIVAAFVGRQRSVQHLADCRAEMTELQAKAEMLMVVTDSLVTVTDARIQRLEAIVALQRALLRR